MKTWENCDDRLEAVFVSEKDAFVNNLQRGLPWLDHQVQIANSDRIAGKQIKVSDIFSSLKRHTYIYKGDYILENHIEFEKFVDSKILVVGGGPTTNEVNWDIDNYDYVFSCNHFFKSKKLKDKKVDLFFVGNEVDTNEEVFLNYCDKYNPLIGIEDLMHRPAHVQNLVCNFPEKAFFCTCRYQSKLTGMASKLVLLALDFQAKHVDFVGIDGVPSDFHYLDKIPHGFEGKKLFRENKISHYKQIKEQYLFFDKYIRENFPNVIINNLGKDSKFNYAYQK